ncbi:MAG: (2Fe-2S)-binding protein [Acidobacteriota bacterium]
MSGETVCIEVDGRELVVPSGQSLAVALFNAGVTAFRRSVTGEPRAPLCGMGTCHECRVTVDDVAGRRSCLLPVREGQRVTTGE